MSTLTPPLERRATEPVARLPESAARRRAAVVASLAGIALPVWFWISEAVWGLADLPETDAVPGQYVDFYVDNFSRFPANATAYVGLWVLVLVLLVAVVRATVSRIGLAAILAISLAGAATASTVMTEGVRVWPALTFETPEQLADTLDPVVAQALVLSRSGLHAPAVVLSGLAMLVIAWLLWGSDLWGHRTLAIITGLAGAATTAFMFFGPEGPALTIPWGIVMAMALLIGLRRRRART